MRDAASTTTACGSTPVNVQVDFFASTAKKRPRLVIPNGRPKALSAATLDRLNDQLKAVKSAAVMNIERTDGFFTAAMRGPGHARFEDYLPRGIRKEPL